ncbi:MAG TPA: phage major capsid protein [Xanthobacteraceae bacterium]|nr:phage major capsid protein [Xanthobacteraceae bacterium]
MLGAALAALGPMSANERRAGRYLRDHEGHSPGPLATLQALRERRTSLVAELRGIIDAAEGEDRDLTAEEQSTYDAKKAELDALDKRIARFTSVSEAEAAGATVVPAAARSAAPGAPPGPHAATEFANLGEFMHAVRFNRDDARLNWVENAAAPEGGEIGAEMRMDNDTQGGFMIPPQLRSTILSVAPQDALVRPRANVIPAGSPPDAGITMPALDQSGANPSNMFGGVEVQWIGEGEEKPETDAALKSVTLTPHEVAGTITVTDKLLRNWQAASSFLENLLRGAVNQAEDYAFLRGTGVNQPLGVLNAGATKYINRAVANQVAYADLVDMVARLLMRGGTSPVWSIPQAALPQLAKMTDPEGHYIWVPNARDGFAGTLLGYPVRWNNRAPLLGSKGDIILADWSYYLIKDGSGPFVAASEHVKFTQNKTVVKIFWNVDGAPWLQAPIKEENGWEVSPFVGLDVPA